MTKNSLVIIALSFLIASCFKSREDNRPGENVPGYIPVYGDKSATTVYKMLPPRPTVHPGKIYVIGKTIFQNEDQEGFHIVDNTDSTNPKKIGFFTVVGSTEMSITNNFAYINSLSDLLTFDISNIMQPKLVSRLQNTFPAHNPLLPPAKNTYFICVDPSKGDVIAWRYERNIAEAKCYY